ncbi:mannose-1-phosphate guanylyltransferase/mannose-6-phosphate isomerase [Gluconobacter kanchanaburiensis]|uniref:mannose-1-phosphate guanylyltransferase n=1 Tax=Gluconobacter kanchanaburiensis NBRC 103587 TaxID=1307948 RepID=A0A511B9L9_9PROT|nr:mannose-1-phosphate guanylyltransferase/mannose-6-phosphate isomerase [Gluconobacter kanchanaburiensis]MBF0862845.1 mannose-1-phosphate guanylyltransferase/mannose-6-phosphate isomerase [Gluconobacter kanchanaburiensis]GBR70474.1 mannose-1-phosphate guanylyltransferase [Gluconobacter kanchanaburiensis NBRC 103587]GEK97129.1 mannose-1-phosphate guanylyltransferase/mannose-6-phosphate isomerase [Gluconobacter kanchanaburiensis NBRC 103587]
MSQKIVPVILSGGSGSRLWPVSRSSYPKQFWPLLTERSLIQETALRGARAGLAAPIVICNAEHRFIVAEQLRDVGVDDARIVLEPVGRNSAPAITAAAFLVAETDPDAVLWIMAADAAITDEAALYSALEQAVTAAADGRIVTFGMTPTRVETGYGYIESGALLSGIDGVFEVSRFVEKPDLATAETFFRDGRYLWNSGMFVTRADVFLSEIEAFEPSIHSHVGQAVLNRKSDLDFDRLDDASFRQSPDISVDYAVAERTKRAAVVPGTFGWSDIGSWDALWDLSPKDAEGNATFGDVFLDGTRNCYVRSDGIVATVAGVEDLVVVVTQDAVMVSHRDRAQDVKHMVSRLKKAGRKEAAAHNRMYRPWGFYESLIQADRFQVKRIVVEPGQKLSLQKHFHRAEHWVVVGGTALVTRDADQIMVRENESVYLPLGCVHRLENPGRIPLTLIEVQSGPYLGEDDIVRIEDVYSRN